MEILENVKNNKRNLPALSDTPVPQLEQLFEQLRKRGVDDRLIHILHTFFNNGNRRNPDDIGYCNALLHAIANATQIHQGNRLKIKLMQNFVMHGLNEPTLAMYYLDVLTEIRDQYTWEQSENLVKRLLIKISSPPFYQYRPELPSLQEILKEHLEEWMIMIEKDKYGFYTLKNGTQSPLFKLNVSVPIFMHIIRVMFQTELMTLLIPTSQFFRFLSRIVHSSKGEKLKTKTFQNGYTFDQPANIKTTIRWLKKLRREAREIQDQAIL